MPSAMTPVQSPLNLMLTIKPDQAPAVAAYLLANQAGINNALTEVGTVHFARFLFVPGTQILLVLTEYDGDFAAYIQAFTKLLGPVFDAVLSYMDPAPPLPVEQNVDAFGAFVKQYNLTTGLYAAYPYCTVQQIRSYGCAQP